jgi:PAS domain S-box-containing protein
MTAREESIRVLLVDDGPDAAGTVDTLERDEAGFVVDRVADASSGLDQLCDEVDCVVSEYALPDADGLEFFESAREVRPELPFVMYTEAASDDVATDAATAGVTEFLRKDADDDARTNLTETLSATVAGGVSDDGTADPEQGLNQILSSVPDCIVLLDTDGRFTYANRQAEAVLGLDRPSVTDRTYNDPEWEIKDLDGEPIPDADLPFARVRDTEEPLYGYHHTIEWPDGTTRALAVNGAPLFDADEDLTGVVFSLTDVTKRLRDERKREEVIERVTDAIVEVDADWRFTLVNDRAEELYDMSEGSLIGEDFWDVFADALGTRFESEYRSVMETREPTTIEEYFSGLDGWFDVTVYPNDDGGLAFYFEEITDRREQTRRYEAVFDNSYTFLGLLQPDGTLVEANKTALELADADRGTVVGRKLWETTWIRPFEDSVAAVRSAVETARNGELARAEIQAMSTGGPIDVDFTVRPIMNDQGEVTLLIPEGRDVSDVRRRERAIEGLHDTDRRLMTAKTFDAVTEITVDAASDVLGLPAIAVFAHDAEADVLRPVDWAPGADELIEEMPTFGPGDGIAWTVFETGETRYYDDVSTVPTRQNPETNIRSEILLPLGDHGVLVTGSSDVNAFDQTDVSLAESLATHVTSTLDRIEREQAVRRERERAEELNRQLSVLNRVLRHDLRNRANVILARTDLLLEGDDPETHAPSIKAEANRLVEMGEHARAVERLLRETDADIETIDLATLLQEHVDRIAREHDDVGVALSLPGTAPVAAHSLIDLAIENVLDNAIEHNHSAQPQIDVECVSVDDDTALEVRIADDGPGIPESEVAVLERGYETQLEHTSGLGLWLVNWIVTESGGEVWFEENDPTGSVVGLRFENTLESTAD